MSHYFQKWGLHLPKAERQEFREGLRKVNMRRVTPVAFALLAVGVFLLIRLFYARSSGAGVERFGAYSALYFLLIAMCGGMMVLARLYRAAPDHAGEWIGVVAPLTAWLSLTWAAAATGVDFFYAYLQPGIYIVVQFLCASVFLLDALPGAVVAVAGQAVFLCGAYLVVGLEGDFQRLCAISTLSTLAAYVVSRVLFVEACAHQRVERTMLENNKKLFALNAKLEQLSAVDPLTQLMNRRKFSEVSEQEWRKARREGRLLLVAIADIDDFKAYNDFYGHQAGDECLQRVASAMRDTLRRANDTIARYGGEEFIMVIAGGEVEQNAQNLERVRAAVEQLAIPHAESRVAQVVTISLGAYALVPGPMDTLEEAIHLADQALYDAKHAGRNRVVMKVGKTMEMEATGASGSPLF